MVAAGALFRAGVILNAGDAIERLAEVDTIVFDKTGTLTLPEPRVDKCRRSTRICSKRAARLALSSRHPLATALAREARERRPYAGAIEEPGQGVRAIIDGAEARLGSPASAACRTALPRSMPRRPDASFIAFAHGERPPSFPIRQTLRPDAVAVIEALRERGLDLIDPVRRPAGGGRAGGAALGIADWQGGLKPGGKDRRDRCAESARPSRADGRRWTKRRAVARGRACLDVADHRGASDPGSCGCAVPRRSIAAGAAGGAICAARPRG